MNGNWLSQSFAAMLLAAPVYIAIGFFAKNYSVKPEVILIWYFAGVALSSVIFSGNSAADIFLSWKFIVAIALMGLTIGGASNIFFFRAIAAAPNKGLPVAIFSSSSVVVLVATVFLARVWPDNFEARFDGWSAVGVALAIAGITIIAVRR